MNTAAFGEECRAPESIYWEFRLPKREEDKENGWPDLAAIWTDRVVLFELKTEAGSHRDGQVDWYLQLGRHNYSDKKIDLIYLTTDPVAAEPKDLGPKERYGNLIWTDVARLIEQTWGEDPLRLESASAIVFADYLRGVGRVQDVPSDVWRSSHRPTVTEPVLSVPTGAVGVAEPPTSLAKDFDALAATVKDVARDGKQRALEIQIPSVEQAKETKRQIRAALETREDLAEPLQNIEFWIWREATGGKALSDPGAKTGVELRLSRRSPKSSRE